MAEERGLMAVKQDLHAFRNSVQPALERVFRYPIVFPNVFPDTMRARLILECSVFALDQRRFEAISRAAEAIGDDFLLLTLLSDYTLGPGETANISWKVPLNDFPGYENAPYDDTEVEEVFGIPLYRILHSPGGHWGILFDDNFAVLGGSASFVRHFKREYPRCNEDIDSFIQRRLFAARERKADMNWVRPLLVHIYGDNAPEFEP